ncbi:hypothetical protein [Corynebacterium striatum]|uniref:hypothetical protein n=1 Tax=Corynebacterium striatum TaxID=43770 RepID=UPI003B594140
MMQLIFTERVEILRPRRIPGDYGGYTTSWDNPEVIPVAAPVSVQQVSTTEDETRNGQLVSTKWRLYSQPPHILDQLKPDDRIRVIGGVAGTWVVGDPEHWRGPLLPHTEVDLEVYRGTNRA